MNLRKFNVIRIIITTLALANGTFLLAQDREVKIAIAQIFCLDSDRSGNFVRIENAIDEASKKRADIVCFPETSLLGWVNPEAHHRAFPIPGEDSDRLCALAVKYDLFLCIGLAEKEGDTLYDTVILIDNNGNIILKHRKINILTHLMDPPYTPGSEVKAAETEFGRIGLLICADSFKEDILLRMKDQKPDIVLIPYGWAAEENRWPDHGKELSKTVQNSAKIIGCPVVGNDLVGEITNGPWRGLVYGGQSVVSDEKGQILCRCKDRDRDLQVITIYLKQVVVGPIQPVSQPNHVRSN